MRFEWDENKNRRNQAKHGISFEMATSVFNDPYVTSIPDRYSVAEERWKTFGQVEGILVLLVVHTVKEVGTEDVIRIISARKATKREMRDYENNLKENYERT